MSTAESGGRVCAVELGDPKKLNFAMMSANYRRSGFFKSLSAITVGEKKVYNDVFV